MSITPSHPSSRCRNVAGAQVLVHSQAPHVHARNKQRHQMRELQEEVLPPQLPDEPSVVVSDDSRGREEVVEAPVSWEEVCTERKDMDM